MARSGPRAPLSRRNVLVDSFLQRNMEREVYELIRVHEPCVVLSDTINKAYMHVVLSDERVYLTEFPPRTLTAAVSFGRVRDIELVNDLPDFLSAKYRERCQHIRIVYIADKPAEKNHHWLKRYGGVELPPLVNECPTPSDERPAAERIPSPWITDAPLPALRSTRSASCPDPETLGLLRVPHPPFTSVTAPPSPTPPTQQSRRSWPGRQGKIGSVFSRLLRRGAVGGAKGKEAELHLYAVSHSSRLYLHLQSSWNSFIIKSTLLLDPLHGRRCSSTPDSFSSISAERTAWLFSQLSSELLQDGIPVERLYLLLQELNSAARRLVPLRRLFWRSAELCVFLVQTLEECLHAADRTADRLLMSTLVVQTLAVMFRETELERARISLLADRKGALASRLLLALVCDPKGGNSELSSEVEVLLKDFLDSSCSLLFELLLLGHESRQFCAAENILTVGWILHVLQPHPHLQSFLALQAQQVVKVLQLPVLAPLQAVLLFQRCRLLMAFLQHSRPLAEHLQSQLEEEFRYFVKASFVQHKLPPQYPISQPTLRLLHHIQTIILHT